MSRATGRANWQPVVLAALLGWGPLAPAQDEDSGTTVPEPVYSPAERSLLEVIEQIESSGGAYAAELPEHMLSLGTTLLQEGRNGEAVDVFKRGVHLARINGGLYCQEQIPLLEGEIKGFLALGDYAAVDERQQYLYRVQRRALTDGTERASALMNQANWQFNAYQLRVGEQDAARLVSMWELYREAWSELSELDGETSTSLLPPLQGLLRTQYLISEYRAASEAPGNGFNASANRINAYRAENYDLGKSVILTIYNIQRVNLGADSDEAVEALVALGDWAQWSGKRSDAEDTYRMALAELALRDDAQQEEQRLFAEPVPLPDIAGLRTLPPPVDAEEGNILVEFGVDSRGRVVDLERLDTEAEDNASADRLLRVLRDTQFRPRFEAGQPAETDKLVRAYDITP